MEAIMDRLQEIPFGKEHPALNGMFAAAVIIATWVVIAAMPFLVR